MAEIKAVTLDVVPAAERKEIGALKRSALDLAARFGEVREKVSEAAPRFIKLYTKLAAWAADQEVPFTMAGFARLFDPTVPTFANKEGKGYTFNRTYQLFVYMKRQRTQAESPKGTKGEFDGAVKKAERLARTLLALSVSTPESIAAFWAKFATEFDMNDAQMRTLQRRVGKVDPVFNLEKFIDPIDFSKVPVVHMDSIKQPRTTTTVAQLKAVRDKVVARGIGRVAKAGQRVRVKAA